MSARARELFQSGLATLQALGQPTYLWTFTPPGEGSFDLPQISNARRALFRPHRLRPALGAYGWVVQGPQVVRESVERLHLHVAGSGWQIDHARLSELATRSGFGSDVDVRTIDRAAWSASEVGRYMGRFLQRDGYRLTEHHPRVVLHWFSPEWPRSER